MPSATLKEGKLSASNAGLAIKVGSRLLAKVSNTDKF